MNFYGLYAVGSCITLLVSGCRWDGCVVEEAKSFKSGEGVTRAVEQYIIRTLRPGWRLWICGGDSFEPENLNGVLALVRKVKRARPDTEVVMWTSHTYNEAISTKAGKSLVKLVDVLMTGDKTTCIPQIRRRDEYVGLGIASGVV